MTDYQVQAFDRGEFRPVSRGPRGFCDGVIVGLRHWSPTPALRLVRLADGQAVEVVKEWEARQHMPRKAGGEVKRAPQGV